MICNKCGKTLPDDSTFCQFCGSKIEIIAVSTDETPSVSKEEVLAKVLAAGVVEGQKAMEANKESQPHNELDADFGFVPQKPVYTVGIDEQEKYLKSLRTINGDPIKWNRRGSMSVDGVNGIVDVYDTYLPSGEEYKTLYINMYGAYNSTFAPKGFAFAGFNDVRVNTSPTKSSKKKCFLISTPFLWILFVASLLTLALVIATAVGQNINYDESQDAWNHHQATLTDKTVGCVLTSACTSAKIGRVPSITQATQVPDAPSGRPSKSIWLGFGTSIRPRSAISKTPISLVEPKRFFAARRRR